MHRVRILSAIAMFILFAGCGGGEITAQRLARLEAEQTRKIWTYCTIAVVAGVLIGAGMATRPRPPNGK